ncbi:MAG: efflux RND transporter periplasmic adaptor subunit [Granulosicoccaceae bacterium]
MGSEKSGLQVVLGVALPVLVLAAGAAAFMFIKANPPEAPKRPPTRTQVVPVEATTLKTQSYTVKLRSFGSVVPRKQTTLVAQVSGVVAEVSPSFQAGSRFEQGDVLLALDSSDYQIAVRSAEAALVQARAQYTQEKVQGDQAAADWKKLGKRGKPGALVLRTPQRQAALAQVQSAEAQLERAKLDLSRTQITAPYDGQVLSRSVDEGRFITTGNVLGVVFAADAMDVRLPLNSAQLEQMDLQSVGSDTASVELFGDDKTTSYKARLARSEGQIDVSTRQLFVVAEVEAAESLSVGQFVEARLPGKRYDDVFVFPERLLRPEGDVFLVNDGKVARAQVQVLYNDGTNAIVTGLQAGDELILTPLGSAVSGMRVAATVDGEAPARSSSGGSGSPVGRQGKAGPEGKEQREGSKGERTNSAEKTERSDS